MEQITAYVKESYNELLNKVTWPTMEDLQSNTVLVLVASMIIALVIFLMDAISNTLLSNLIYGT